MPAEITAPTRAKGIVHKMIADVAKGCAREEWEKLAKQNRFHKAYPQADPFVDRHWPKYLGLARQLLVAMLGMPKYTEAQKAEIYDVLLKDGAVNPRKMAEPEKPSFFMSPPKKG